MFDIEYPAASGPVEYDDLIAAARALTTGESDPVANMANIAALLWHYIPDLNWAGFYRNISDELILGPFQGKAACIRIPFGKGVCGTAAAQRRTVRVEDVHLFPGHIACDAASASEIVIPVIVGDRLVAVIDLDSPRPARFSAYDADGLERLAAAIGPAIAG